MRRRVLIAGCGDLGVEVARRLDLAGDAVYGLRRSPFVLPGAARPIVADLLDPGLPEHLPPRLEAVVFAAAPTGPSPAAYAETYGRALDNLMQAVSPRRFLLVSSTGVYGEADGAWIDETTPAAPADARSEALLAAEQRVAELAGTVTVLRLAGIYGPGRTRLLRTILGDPAAWMSDELYGNRIHRDDAAAAIVHLLGMEDPPELLIGSDDRPASRGEVTRWLLQHLGKPLPASPGTPAPARRGNKRCRTGGSGRRGSPSNTPASAKATPPLLDRGLLDPDSLA